MEKVAGLARRVAQVSLQLFAPRALEDVSEQFPRVPVQGLIVLLLPAPGKAVVEGLERVE